MHILVYYKSSIFICNIIFHTVCTVKECRFIAETYRRGHNGTDSKSVYRCYTDTRVRIPPSPLHICFFCLQLCMQIFVLFSHDAIPPARCCSRHLYRGSWSRPVFVRFCPLIPRHARSRQPDDCLLSDE